MEISRLWRVYLLRRSELSKKIDLWEVCKKTRQKAYEASSTLHHQLNHTKRAEPSNLQEAFDPEFYREEKK